MNIQRLSESIIAQIRAGEFVRRPANIVKELVENSIDGGSSLIEIDIEDGGRKSIRVQDNGKGIAKGELELAVERHATSKLNCENLDSIKTLGFRGEGLASIGAVCDMSVSSRIEDDDCAWSIDVKWGTTSELYPSRGKEGTVVVANHMFAQHPARFKDLRSSTARTEALAIKSVVEDLALAHPHIGFILKKDDKVWLSLQSEEWDSRVLAVMGEAFSQNSAAVEWQEQEFTLRGFVSLPTWRVTSGTGQRFLVNSRPVKEKLFSNAIKQAFRDLAPDSVPGAVLELKTSFHRVDVNVHPEKREILLREPAAISQALVAAIRQAVGKAGPLAAASLSLLAAQAAQPYALLSEHKEYPLGEAVGTIKERYAIGVKKDGMVLVDIHAASERVVYEILKAHVSENGVPLEPLNEPISILVSEWSINLLEARQESMRKLGMDIRVDEEGAKIWGVPQFLPHGEARTLVDEIITELETDPYSDPLEAKLEKFCALIACHGAIRSGDKVDLDTINQLFRQIESIPQAAHCMHGRPVAILWDGKKLDGLFGR